MQEARRSKDTPCRSHSVGGCSSREISDSSSFFSRRYQKAHIRTRNSVERAFGVWKRRFPCLDMRLQHKPERSAVIITACAALHNLARLRNEPCPPPMPTPPVPPQRRRRQPHLPQTPDPVDTINGAWKRAQIISRSFTY
ncbi:putative nuclease HARBI1 [Ixodes scapularis]